MIKMEQRRRIKGVNVKDAKKVKGKAVIGIAIAAIILASVFVATVTMVSAESRGDNFNHIVVQQAPQKVLIGQNLEFEGFTGIAVVYRLVGGDIVNIYPADGNNRIYNVNWPTSGAYYVNYVDRTTYDARFSVEDANMPLELRVGTTKVSSIAVGTMLRVDTTGINLFDEDLVNLVVIGPDGQIKYDAINDQCFTRLSVADLKNYGDDGLRTDGWKIGDYTFQVKARPECACGLEAESATRALKIKTGELAIEAETTSCIELQTVRLTVTGVADDEIKVEALSPHVIFKAGMDDTPQDATNWFNDVIDADGIRKYAVEFDDSGTYALRVTAVSGPRAYDSDTVDITVSEKLVTFDVPPTVTIGEDFTIRGGANIGSTVDIAVDDYVYPLLNDRILDDKGEFSVDVTIAEIATFSDTGPVRLTAYIDRAAGAGDAFEACDGTAKLFMVNEAGGGIVISASETSVGKNETIILAISAVPNHNVSVTTSDQAHTVFEYNRYDFTGTSSNIINIAPSDTISIPADLGDCDSYTAAKDINGVWEMMNADGILKFAVHFTDLGTYKITATDYGTGDPTATRLDAKSVNITVTAKNVTFDLPSAVVIGDKITIKGTVDTGTYVSVYIADVLYRKLQNLVIADGEFRQEVKTTDVGLCVPGIVELKAYIDCDKMCGDPQPTGSDDGTTNVFMVEPWLTASLSTDSVDPEDDFTVSGSAPGSTEVVIVCVPPRGGGGKSLLDKGMKGLSHRKATVSSTDTKYIKNMTVQDDADPGVYYVIVLSSGLDGVWSMTGESNLEAALDEKYCIPSLTMGIINVKTQDEIKDILEDLVTTPGADDLMWKGKLKVGTPFVKLDPIETVCIGEPLVVTGTANREEGFVIVVTCKGPAELMPQVVKIENGAFKATFDTTDAKEGTYEAKVDDGYGYPADTSVNIIAGTPAPP
jgi:hypothetical protein